VRADAAIGVDPGDDGFVEKSATCRYNVRA
jgi:hypothetical protein